MPQQRRAQATRRAIVIAAAEEFDRVGYDATPLSAVLRRSGVTKGAFYFHFASKESLAAALIQLQNRRWPTLRQRWLGRGLDPLSVAIGMVDEATRLIEEDVVLRAGTSLARHRIADEVAERRSGADWETLLADLLRRSAERGLLRSGVEPAEVARVVHAAIIGARTLGSERSGGPGATARTSEVWRVTLRGVASAEWLSSHQLPGAVR